MSTETFKVRLHGGPMHGTELELPAGTMRHRIGRFWTYENTGLTAPDGRYLFAKVSGSRLKRRMLIMMRAATGRDQRLYEPLVPTRRIRHTSAIKQGKAARARAAKREAQ